MERLSANTRVLFSGVTPISFPGDMMVTVVVWWLWYNATDDQADAIVWFEVTL